MADPPLDTAPDCPRCAEPAPAAAACAGCGAPHHTECARTFGACGRCGGPVQPEEPAAVVLPRLAALSRRLEAWRLAGTTPPEAWAVVLRPADAAALEETAAAEALGQVVGGGAYEGRQRLVTGLPEPLVRVARPDGAADIERALGAVGLSAFHAPVGELVLAPEPFRATAVELGDPLGYTDAEGRRVEHSVSEPRLVVTGTLVGGAEAARRARGVTPSASLSRATLRMGGGRRRDVQGAAWVFLDDRPAPVLVRERAIGDYSVLQDQMTVSSAKNFELLVHLLAQGADTRALPREAAGDALVGPDGSNEAAASLLARLLQAAWRREREQG